MTPLTTATEVRANGAPQDAAHSSATARPSTTGRKGFVKAFPGLGRGNVSCAVVAAGSANGAPARLALTVDRHVTVDVKFMPTAADFTANINAGTSLGQVLARTAETALRATAKVHGLTGHVTGTLRMPPIGDGGADVFSAASHAAVNALSAAAEVLASDTVHAEVSRACGWPLVTAPNAVGVHAHDTRTGSPLSAWETFPRFYTVYLHQVSGPGGTDTFALTDVGEMDLVPLSGTAGNWQDAAEWLSAASASDGVNPVRHILQSIHEDARIRTCAVVGGHTPGDPVALLLPPDHTSLLSAQRAHTLIPAALKDQFGLVGAAAPWRATTSRLSFS